MGTPAVQVRINGRDYEFWLDTGSSMTVLSSTVASEAGIPFVSADTLRIRTFEGTAPVKAGIVRRLEIGPIGFTNTPAIVMDADLIRVKSTSEGITGQGVRVDGIIGWDVIRQFDVVLDYRSGTITFKKPERLGIIGTEFQNLTWVGKPLVQVPNETRGHVRIHPGHWGPGNASQRFDTGQTGNSRDDIRRSRIRDRKNGRTDEASRTESEAERGRKLSAPRKHPRLWAYSGLINCDGILGSDVAQFGKLRIDATNGLFSLYE
jgi:hypothetical protein